MATKPKSTGTPNPKRGLKKKADSDELVFSILSKETIEDLDKCNNDTNAEFIILADSFGLNGWSGDLPLSIQLNMFHNLYIFAKENKLSTYQSSILFSLFKITLDKLIENAFQSLVPIEDFKSLLLKQLKQDSTSAAHASNLLNLEVCTLITQYVSKSLFQHLNLYKYVFTQEQEQGQIIESKTMELPPLIFLPLGEARTAESVLQEEEEERQRIANMDTFNSDIDIFESLSPEEIKKVTAETVASLVEQFKQDTEKMVQDQKAKTLTQNLKLMKEF